MRQLQRLAPEAGGVGGEGLPEAGDGAAGPPGLEVGWGFPVRHPDARGAWAWDGAMLFEAFDVRSGRGLEEVGEGGD